MRARMMMTGGAIASLVAGIALAQAPAAPSPMAHAGMAHGGMARPMMPDTREGVNAMVAEMFARVDADRDGTVTKAEREAMRASHEQMRGEHIEKRMEQRIGDPRAAFDRLDANKDGKLSFEEFEKGRELRIEKRVERRMDGHHGGGMAMMFGMADANRDGGVTLAEAQAMAMKHFDMADTNRDGRISPEERVAMHEKMRAMHKQMHTDAKPAS